MHTSFSACTFALSANHQQCVQGFAEEDDANQYSSQSQSVADSDDDEDYEPESLSKHKSWACSASEDEGGEQSTGWDDDDGHDCGEGGQCEQDKVRLLLGTLFAAQMCIVC